MDIEGSGSPNRVPLNQADAAISQANPVSDTVYPVLATTANVRIIGISANITWGVTQPTNLRVIVTVDGQTYTFTLANPVTATNYLAALRTELTAANQLLIISTSTPEVDRSFLLEGQSVKVDVAVTWAITQPTPLVCRVRYARIS